MPNSNTPPAPTVDEIRALALHALRDRSDEVGAIRTSIAEARSAVAKFRASASVSSEDLKGHEAEAEHVIRHKEAEIETFKDEPASRAEHKTVDSALRKLGFDPNPADELYDEDVEDDGL